jgi:hypothetical protein
MRNLFIKRSGDPPTGLYNGCLLSIPMWSLIILLTWMSCSCTPKPHIITERTGIVVTVTPTTIEVMYNVLNRDEPTRALNIYYWPEGHTFRIGDPYPPCIGPDEIHFKSFYEKQ